MNLHAIEIGVLVERTKTLVRDERRITLEILHHLREIERRRIYLELGYPSLWDFAIKELGYSEGAAGRRISAMRLLKDLPEIEAKIEDGSISLSVAAKVQNFCRKQRSSRNEKKELVEKLESCSTREADLLFASIAPEALPKEKVRPLSETTVELKLGIDQELMAKLDRLKQCLSHIDPNMSYAELINRLADLGLEKFDPVVRAEKRQERAEKHRQHAGKRRQRAKQTQTCAGNDQACAEQHQARAVDRVLQTCDTGNEENHVQPTNDENDQSFDSNKSASYGESHFVSTERSCDATSAENLPASLTTSVKDAVHKRDRTCTWVDPLTGRRCHSRHLLQVDHIVPLNFGGTNELSNLRILCGEHNRLSAVRWYGERKVEKHWHVRERELRYIAYAGRLEALA